MTYYKKDSGSRRIYASRNLGDCLEGSPDTINFIEAPIKPGRPKFTKLRGPRLKLNNTFEVIMPTKSLVSAFNRIHGSTGEIA